MNQSRAALLAALDDRDRPFDLVVIGGGANGCGIALDAASRGLSVALFERGDFGSGTSSRSSKLIHGGVRYVALGQWSLVREALAERATLLRNAPGLVRAQRFVIPAYSHFDRLRFRLGLKLYDWLAGDAGLTPSAGFAPPAAHALGPALRAHGLRGLVTYDDAMFDDSRLLIGVLNRAREFGALTLNHAAVEQVLHDGAGRACGVVVRDMLGGKQGEIGARAVINAAGAWGDAVRVLDQPGAGATVSPSQGAHVVVDGRFLNSEHALVLPRTRDGRIMFALPWHGYTLLGTTDTAVRETPAWPQAFTEEIDAILEVAANFLDPAPQRSDIRSVFAGLRPLAGVPDGSASATRSREHALDISNSGMLSVSGGKWTTYRRIAEQAVDLALDSAGLSAAASTTAAVQIVKAAGTSDGARFANWGAADELAALVRERPELGTSLHPDLPYCGAHFVWAARAELAVSVSDALAYRARAMFINAAAAAAIAPAVARLMAAELGHDERWIEQQVRAAQDCATRFSPATATP